MSCKPGLSHTWHDEPCAEVASRALRHSIRSLQHGDASVELHRSSPNSATRLLVRDGHDTVHCPSVDLYAESPHRHRAGSYADTSGFTKVLNRCHIQPSNKVAVLRFQRGMQQGLLGRVSRSAVMEYHAFGIISCVHLKIGPTVALNHSHTEKGRTPSITTWFAVCKVCTLRVGLRWH